MTRFYDQKNNPAELINLHAGSSNRVIWICNENILNTEAE